MSDALDWTQLALDIVQIYNLKTIINLRVLFQGSEPLSVSQQWLNVRITVRNQLVSQNI